jgi:ParB family transcriptional regulator, chromosome partitioning protein
MIEEEIQMIEIAQVLIANPRPRNPVKFQAIVASIETVGLKKPITVCRRTPTSGETQYELVCGQGRLEACLALGKAKIPAIIIDATREQQYLMSLIENVARRPPSYRALLVEVRSLVDRGYKGDQIAKKLGLDRTYVYGVVQLLEHGEDVLIQAVDAGRIPMRTAIIISTGTDEEVQAGLIDAYEKGDLRGAKLAMARRIIAMRLAKERVTGQKSPNKQRHSAESLVEEYEQHIQRQRSAISRLNAVSHRLLILSTAMGRLLTDENYVTLLRAESIQTIPKHLAERIG